MGSGGTVDVDLQIKAQNATTAVMLEMKKMATAMNKTMAGIGTKVDKGLTQPLKKAAIAGSQTYGFLKDVGRIAQGILFSQVLYRGILQPIQAAVRELKDFIIQMEQTELAFEMMLGGPEAGQAFVNIMEDFAAVTPFVMENTTAMARYLLGVGFAANEIIPVMTRVTDAMALLGTDPDKLKRLVEALGKIKAFGSATLREIKSIARTGIPVVQILEEQLGMTTAQVRNIAKLGIPGEVVIEAILRGIEERFAGGAERLQRTIGGLMSTISDNMLLISRDIFNGITGVAQNSITLIADRLEVLRRIIRDGGVGALFEEMVPEDLHETIRLIVGTLSAIGKEIAKLFKALIPFGREFLRLGVIVSSVLLPVLLHVAKAISGFFTLLSSNTRIVKVFTGALVGMLVASTVAHTINVLSKALLGLSKMLMLTMATNWIGWIGLAAGALIAFALTTDWAKKKLQEFQNVLGDATGVNTKYILRPIEKMAEDIPDISLGMTDIEDGLEDIGDAAGDAAKEVAKILASFDEVYDITEKKAKAGGIDLDFAFGGFDMGLDAELEDWKDRARTVEELWSGVVDGIRRGRGGRMTMEHLDDIMVPKLLTDEEIQAITDAETKKYADEWWKNLGENILGGLETGHTAVMEALTWFSENVMNRSITEDWEWFKETDFAKWFVNLKWLDTEWWNDKIEAVQGVIADWSIWDGSWWVEKFKPVTDFFTEWSIWDPEWWTELGQPIIDWFDDIAWLDTEWWGEKWDAITEYIGALPVFEADWWKSKLQGPLAGIITFFNGILESVERTINAIGARISGFRFTLPNWMFGGGTFGLSIPTIDIPKIPVPQLADGGIVSKDQIVRVGEHGEKEMVAPLNEQTLKPFADMIAGFISGNPTENDSDYVMVRANKQDLTNLYRQLFTIQKSETIRGLS